MKQVATEIKATSPQYVSFLCACGNSVSAYACVLASAGYVRCQKCRRFIKAGSLEVLTMEDIEARVRNERAA